MKNHLSFLTVLLPLFFAFSNPESPEITCPAPSNVHVTAVSTGTISFEWDDCGCVGNGYKVKYVRQSDGYTSPEVSTTNSNFTFSGLSAGKYTFYFWTDCGGEKSEIIGVEDVLIG